MSVLEYLEKYDTKKLYKVYDTWPEIAQSALESVSETIDVSNVNHIIFAGMGGSGTIGDIFSSILSKTHIHISVIKGYLLPASVDENTLVVTTSVSGNTEETLKILESSKNLNCKTVSFSSSGKMKKYCNDNNLLHVNINEIHSPRASLTQFLYTMLKFLQPVVTIKDEDIFESITQLQSLCKKISSINLTEDNPSLALAHWLPPVPLIYFPSGLQAAAIRFKNSLQENAKTHVITEDIVEASHNGIISWEKPSDIKPILIQGQDDYIKTKQRWSILKQYFQEKNIDYWEVFSINGSILSKLINLIYLLDYSSIYRAVISKTDPSPTLSIDYFKEKSKNNYFLK